MLIRKRKFIATLVLMPFNVIFASSDMQGGNAENFIDLQQQGVSNILYSDQLGLKNRSYIELKIKLR